MVKPVNEPTPSHHGHVHESAEEMSPQLAKAVSLANRIDRVAQLLHTQVHSYNKSADNSSELEKRNVASMNKEESASNPPMGSSSSKKKKKS